MLLAPASVLEHRSQIHTLPTRVAFGEQSDGVSTTVAQFGLSS